MAASPRRLALLLRTASLLLLSSAVSAAEAAAPDNADLASRPLSPAQIALFETPHLQAIDHPETLRYRYERVGLDPLVDSVTLHIETIHPDGTKYVSFEFLTGEHHQFFPAVDEFKGNPLLMLFLEHDVREMKQQFGVASAYFRDQVRSAFVDRAKMADTTIELDGKTVPAKEITLKPYEGDARFEKLPAVKDKTYSFILSDQVPGEIQQLKIDEPADPESHAPAWSETISFAGVTP
ncbi:MAG TPA: hypothetical protein VM689_16635 [Aliidongia sp.]|nr:hypothetical protein [Aliidongia sp.]